MRSWLPVKFEGASVHLAFESPPQLSQLYRFMSSDAPLSSSAGDPGDHSVNWDSVRDIVIAELLVHKFELPMEICIDSVGQGDSDLAR